MEGRISLKEIFGDTMLNAQNQFAQLWATTNKISADLDAAKKENADLKTQIEELKKPKETTDEK